MVDDDGNELPPNTEGRLFFADATGRGVVYPNDPEKTAAAHLRPGVFTLGEIGYLDDDGYVFITDRFSDMIVSGGANIYPAEAEQVLLEHPGVADVAVIGVPHPDMGEEREGPRRPGRPGRPAERRTSSSRCAASACRGYKCPRSVDIVDDRGSHHDGQGEQAGAARALLGRRPDHRRLTMGGAEGAAEPLVLVDEPAAGVRRLTLNRPTKRNALSHGLRGAAVRGPARGRRRSGRCG